MTEEVKLKARFIRVKNSDGTTNFDETYWQVCAGEMEICTMTVKSICATNPILDYDAIATPDFGRLLMRKVKKLKAFW